VPRCDIIQEKQRFSPLTNKIVYTHGHKVDAQRIEMTGVDGNAEFGPHPIRHRHENGVFIPGSFEVKQRPEPAQSAEDARPRGPVRRRFDPVHQSVASIDIDTSVVIVDAMALTLVSHAVSQLRAA